MSATSQAEQNALTLPERAAVALGAAEHEIKLLELVRSSADIVAVIDPAGREQAHRIAMTLKGARVGIEKAGKMAREDAVAFGKAIIAEEKRLVALVAPEEDRVIGLRDVFDEAEQARKDALIAAERQRVDAIEAAIQAIRDIPIGMAGKSSQDISHCIAGLAGTIPDEFYEELIEKAKLARHESLDKLAAMETAQRGLEIEAESQRQEAARQAAAAEEARVAELARLEAQRIENARVAAENERIANEQAKERQRLADQEATQALAARQLAEKAAANLKAERDAQEELMRIQREAAAEAANKLATQQAAFEAKQAAFAREQQEARERAEAAAKREADHPEALAMNAEFDAAALRAAEAQAMVDRAIADASAAPATADELMADAGFESPDLTDEEIIAFGAECGLGLSDLVARLEAFTAWARAKLLVAV